MTVAISIVGVFVCIFLMICGIVAVTYGLWKLSELHQKHWGGRGFEVLASKQAKGK